jgi:N-acetylglucosamine kinase-like BadF-type ATPase
LQVGGWGYLLGDEGSGYWIGRELLRQALQEYDRGWQANESVLARASLDEIGLSHPQELVAWVYQSDDATAARIGELAPLVLAQAAGGNEQAMHILRCAAGHLADQARTLRQRLDYAHAPIAFAGGLLDNDNWLSIEVTRRLSLAKRPVAKHPPVIGAAMLANLEWSAAKQ